MCVPFHATNMLYPMRVWFTDPIPYKYPHELGAGFLLWRRLMNGMICEGVVGFVCTRVYRYVCVLQCQLNIACFELWTNAICLENCMFCGWMGKGGIATDFIVISMRSKRLKRIEWDWHSNWTYQLTMTNSILNKSKADWKKRETHMERSLTRHMNNGQSCVQIGGVPQRLQNYTITETKCELNKNKLHATEQ